MDGGRAQAPALSATATAHASRRQEDIRCILGPIHCGIVDDYKQKPWGARDTIRAVRVGLGVFRVSATAPLQHTWLAAFDAWLVRNFAVDHAAAGTDAPVLQRCADLSGDQAAMAFEEGYELARLGWWS